MTVGVRLLRGGERCKSYGYRRLKDARRRRRRVGLKVSLVASSVLVHVERGRVERERGGEASPGRWLKPVVCTIDFHWKVALFRPDQAG